MKPIYAAYTQEVYANLRPLHATWEPTQPIRLGDIGVLDGRTFRRETDLKTVGITFSQRHGEARPNISFGSHGTTDFVVKPEIRAGSGVVEQSASIEVNFHCEGATFLHLAQCSSTSIQDKADLRNQVLGLFHEGKWRPDWVVISEAIAAEATTIAIAAKGGALLQLEGKVKTPTIDISDIAIRFEARTVKQVGFQLISERGLTPLIGLSKVRRRWLIGEPDFRPSLVGEAGAEGDWDFGEIS